MLPVSALTGEGIDQAWEEISTLADWRREQGHWQTNRARQEQRWFEEELKRGLLARLDADTDVRKLRAQLADEIAARRISPEAAARRVLDQLRQAGRN